MSERRERGRVVVFLVLIALGVAASVYLLRRGGGGEGNALSRSGHGWYGLNALAKAQGVEVELMEDLAQASTLNASSDVLLIAFPTVALPDESFRREVARFVRNGGHLIVGYSGAPFGFAERGLLAEWGIHLEGRQDTRSLLPWRWRRESMNRQAAAADAADGDDPQGRPSLYVPVLRQGPDRIYDLSERSQDGRGSETSTWFVDDEGETVVLATELASGGSIVVVPTGAFSNARLPSAGNLSLALSLLARRGDGPGDRGEQRAARWVFAHGLHQVQIHTQEASGAARLGIRTVILQTLLLYGLIVWVLAYPMARPWPETGERSGSHRDFLRGLGALHDRLGHHSDAGARLLERWRRLRPSDPKTQSMSEETQTREAFLERARALSLDPPADPPTNRNTT